ncbi:PGRS family protein [Sorangium sp. So ce429]
MNPEPGPPDAGTPDADTPDADTPEETCVPRDSTGGVDETCGVFVSASRAGSEGAGTKAEPFASLQEGINLAQQNDTGRVYICAGDAEELSEVVEVPGGITLYGGLDCSDDWTWIGNLTRTVLTANEGEIPLTMDGLPGTVRIEDMHIVAKPTTRQHEGAGVSSIAAVAYDATVELVRCKLEAGNAAQGAAGASPTEPADPGGPGRAGSAACARIDDWPAAGGPAVKNDCGTPDEPNDDSISGNGGDGLPEAGEDGNDGQPLVSANGDVENGGTGRNGSARCTPGLAGNNGSTGTPGVGAEGPGAISMTGYAGAAGTAGGRGAPGQGGGGGGGERGELAGSTEYVCLDGVNETRAGAAGGSGGAGGCGGQGGRGGYAGGSSIALISIDATLSFQQVTLKAGNGGQGGDGGDGQQGGDGGEGGPGGTVYPETSRGLASGCAGGRGGRGGRGGTGGGGQGGHSLGIAFQGTQPITDGVTFALGDAGLGGEGTGDPEHRAADGIASDTLEFN